MEISKHVKEAYQDYRCSHDDYDDICDALRDMTALWMEMTFWDKHKFNRHGCANCSQDRCCIDPGHTWTPADWQAAAHKALMEE